MKLSFRLARDGFRLAPDAVAFGELTCGPAGMLDGLKVRLCFEHRCSTAMERLMGPKGGQECSVASTWGMVLRCEYPEAWCQRLLALCSRIGGMNIESFPGCQATVTNQPYLISQSATSPSSRLDQSQKRASSFVDADSPPSV